MEIGEPQRRLWVEPLEDPVPPVEEEERGSEAPPPLPEREEVAA